MINNLRSHFEMNARKNRLIGYMAGIVAGISYGFNPLFAKHLLVDNVPIYSMLFLRYAIAAVFMGLWMLCSKESFKIKTSQLPILILLGLLFASSSMGLFEAYNYIPAGLATTLCYLYPVFTALVMLFLHKKPSTRTWCSIVATLAGVGLICMPSSGFVLNAIGLSLAVWSAMSYAIYLVIVNNNQRISGLSAHTITLYALIFGAVLFMGITLFKGERIVGAIKGAVDWGCIVGLALIPTLISMLALAISTRQIGATKTAVLGVFEPLTAILIGLLVYGEKLTISIGLGIAICVGAVIFLVTEKNATS